MGGLQPGPFSSAVKAVLDGPLTERGFARGQGGTDESDGSLVASVIYCAAMDDFAERWPVTFDELDARHGDDLRDVVDCIDLTICGSLARGIVGVDLEGVPVGELRLAAPGLAAAEGLTLERQLDGVSAAICSLLPTG